MYALYTNKVYRQSPLEAHGINIVSEISPYGQTTNRHRINLFIRLRIKEYQEYFYKKTKYE